MVRCAAVLLLLAASACAQPISQNHINALVGARGQVPSSSNPFVCDKDTRVDPSGAGTVTARWNTAVIGHPTIINFVGSNISISLDGEGGTANISINRSGGGIVDPTGYSTAHGGEQGLAISCTSNSTVTIAAHLLDVQGNFKSACLQDIALTAVITNNGANGLDSGTVQPNSWYRLWVGAKLDGSEPVAYFTLAGIYYQNYVAGGPPSGTAYKLWRQVDWVNTDWDSHIIQFITVGRAHIYSQSLPDGPPILDGGPGYGSFSPVYTCLSYAPPIPAGTVYTTIRADHVNPWTGYAYDARIRTHGYSSMSVKALKFDGTTSTPWLKLAIQLMTDRTFDLDWSAQSGDLLGIRAEAFDTMLE